MQCPICKQILKEDAKYCGKCGNEIGKALADQEVPKRKPVKKRKLWILKTFLLLIICLSGVFTALFAEKFISEKVNEPESETNELPMTEETGEAEEVAEEIQEPEAESMISIDDINIGDTYIFGTYEQDDDPSNGQEEIEWLVLDKADGKLLVISKYALDCQPYNTEEIEVTWETCTLRQWLNEEFFYSAFSREEQNMISEVTVTADENPYHDTDPGNHTMDRVFLLSILEAEDYLYPIEADMCQPTAYAVAQGAGIAEFSDYEGEGYGNNYIGNCWYWLRSPGDSRNRAADVFYDGKITDFGDGGIESGSSVINDNTSVRPAMWLNLEY